MVLNASSAACHSAFIIQGKSSAQKQNKKAASGWMHGINLEGNFHQKTNLEGNFHPKTNLEGNFY